MREESSRAARGCGRAARRVTVAVSVALTMWVAALAIAAPASAHNDLVPSVSANGGVMPILTIPHAAAGTTAPSPSRETSESVPVPRFEATGDGSAWQAILVVAIPAVPIIIMAAVVFWPGRRDPQASAHYRPGTGRRVSP